MPSRGGGGDDGFADEPRAGAGAGRPVGSPLAGAARRGRADRGRPRPDSWRVGVLVVHRGPLAVADDAVTGGAMTEKEQREMWQAMQPRVVRRNSCGCTIVDTGPMEFEPFRLVYCAAHEHVWRVRVALVAMRDVARRLSGLLAVRGGASDREIQEGHQRFLACEQEADDAL